MFLHVVKALGLISSATIATVNGVNVHQFEGLSVEDEKL